MPFTAAAAPFIASSVSGWRKRRCFNEYSAHAFSRVSPASSSRTRAAACAASSRAKVIDAFATGCGRANLFRNDKGQFTDIAREAGMENSSFGMSTAWGDYDRDGHNDLYLAGMFSSAGSRIVPQAGFRAMEGGARKDTFMVMARGNSLLRNLGGKLEDRSVDANVNMGRWAWATRFTDLYNDGWEDLLVANGWLSNALRDDL